LTSFSTLSSLVLALFSLPNPFTSLFPIEFQWMSIQLGPHPTSICNIFPLVIKITLISFSFSSFDPFLMCLRQAHHDSVIKLFVYRDGNQKL
jgi:hypothetical protein